MDCFTCLRDPRERVPSHEWLQARRVAYIVQSGRYKTPPRITVSRSRTRWSYSSDWAAQPAHTPRNLTPVRSKPELDGEPLLVRLISAHNLPNHDMFSESDVFATIDVLPFGGHSAPILTVAWPVKWDTPNPVWDSCRLLGEAARRDSDLRLRVSFFDYDVDMGLRSKELIGIAEVNVSELEIGAPPTELVVETVKQLKGNKRAITRLQRMPTSTLQQRKTVYIVRHGESVWNEAQAARNVGAMIGDTDHPLNRVGRAQAERLHAVLEAGGADADALMASDLVMCSPLTRAVQTCLIGLAPMLARRPDARLLLNPNLREKRNLGGMDSSGKWHGEQLAHSVRAAMRHLYSDAPEEAERLSSPQFDLRLVQHKWWLSIEESKDLVAERINELLSQVRFSNDASMVLVGHSHFFRELLRRSIAEECELRGCSQSMAELLKKKLSNCGVARLQLDFEREKPVVAVELLFGTTLVN
ncbi:hypothetical protein AB1Y20_010857 [Prymnesium parvum]|uniref:C2 domain-containing protein n=1 Tax=Prymnesium parvum TaxID=97485 RepID=A0AB34IPP2_PRYPA|mmetsp:Transcript_17036/g.39016  ORF Transcript_17036/g.39016 Transcript_17036/m.39016 type:complete len:472 (+) Transcript_17036:91-1506(+)